MTERRLFLVRAGSAGEDEAEVLERDLAVIGFQEIPSLEGLVDYEQIKNVVRAQAPGDPERRVGNRAGQLWAFSLSMQMDDLVVMPRKSTSQIAIGKVAGPYKYETINGQKRHTRPVKWLQTEIPRVAFAQDLLHSFGAFMTVCEIKRNQAVDRVLDVRSGKFESDGLTETPNRSNGNTESLQGNDELVNLVEVANDQVIAKIQEAFRGHDFATLVEEILRAQGWVTKNSPPGPDGGVDILAGQGHLGLDSPTLCVQVKSQLSPADVGVFRQLVGTVQTFGADQGLLVCWGGFNRACLSEAKQNHFGIRLWDSNELVSHIYKLYEKMSPEIQAKLPLKSVWVLVPGEIEE